ncbi:hypothetical protein [Thiocapsa sp.]|uniref:hypothetical protein n=1 Tax=Thiocapsa sp. TaxID=2024551 RepID=UPI003458C26A
MTTKLERFTLMAREQLRERFNSLMGLLFDPEGLRESFERQKGNKAPGVDGVRKDDYGKDLDAQLDDLSARIRRMGYRPQPVRRSYIPKGDGRYRPLECAELRGPIGAGSAQPPPASHLGAGILRLLVWLSSRS